MLQRDNRFKHISYSKVLFTIIIGLVVFLYETPTTTEPNKTTLYNDTTPTQPQHHLHTLLTRLLQEGMIMGHIPSYQTLYNEICLYHTQQCKHIIKEPSSQDNTYYYWAILALATWQTLTHNFHTETTTTIIIKDEPTQKRGYATDSSIIINRHGTQPQEFFEVLTHELGHRIDFGLITGSSGVLNTDFTEFGDPQFFLDDPSLLYYRLSRLNTNTKQASSTPTDFCSEYGTTNPFEDLAECFNLYINHHDYFFSLTQHNIILAQKYNWFKTRIPTNPLQQRSNNYPNHTKRVRDTTKIRKYNDKKTTP